MNQTNKDLHLFSWLSLWTNKKLHWFPIIPIIKLPVGLLDQSNASLAQVTNQMLPIGSSDQSNAPHWLKWPIKCFSGSSDQSKCYSGSSGQSKCYAGSFDQSQVFPWKCWGCPTRAGFGWSTLEIPRHVRWAFCCPVHSAHARHSTDRAELCQHGAYPFL